MRNSTRQHHSFALCPKDVEPTPINRRQAMRELGSVVYAYRVELGVIKIGWTSDLSQRERSLKSANEGIAPTLLAFRPGTRADEAAIHATLIEHRARDHEFYHATADVLAVVNQWREQLGMPELAA